MRWDKLPKPWTREQCRRRYVECSDDIGIRGVATESGRAKSTVQKWSQQLIEGRNWQQQRIHFQASLGTVAQQKTIEKASEKISDDLSVVVSKNYEVHKLARDYAAKLMEARARQLAEDLKLPDEYRRKAIAKHNAAEINNLSQALRRSTDAINEVLGVRYFIDINAAADKMRREGYEIVDPSEDIDYRNLLTNHEVVYDEEEDGDEDI